MRWQIVMSVPNAVRFGFVVWRKIVKEIGAREGSVRKFLPRWVYKKALDHVVSHLPCATHAFFLRGISIRSLRCAAGMSTCSGTSSTLWGSGSAQSKCNFSLMQSAEGGRLDGEVKSHLAGSKEICEDVEVTEGM